VTELVEVRAGAKIFFPISLPRRLNFPKPNCRSPVTELVEANNQNFSTPLIHFVLIYTFEK
jgi:hypothetical protein